MKKFLVIWFSLLLVMVTAVPAPARGRNFRHYNHSPAYSALTLNMICPGFTSFPFSDALFFRSSMPKRFYGILRHPFIFLFFAFIYSTACQNTSAKS